MRPLPAHIQVPALYRRRPLACAVLGVLALAALAERVRGPRPGSDYDRYQNGICTVIRVAGPGVLDVDAPDGPRPATSVRLWGVDVPSASGAASAESAAWLGVLGVAGRELRGHRVRLELSPTRTRDPAGRLLAYVYLVPEGDCVNEAVIESGGVRVDRRWPHPFAERYRTLEARARRRGAGPRSQAGARQTGADAETSPPTSDR